MIDLDSGQVEIRVGVYDLIATRCSRRMKIQLHLTLTHGLPGSWMIARDFLPGHPFSDVLLGISN